MNERWNLTPLYEDFTDPKWLADQEKLAVACKALADFAEKIQTFPAKEAMLGYITCMEEITDLVEKLAGYASLRQSANTKDSAAGSAFGQIMQLFSQTAGPDAACKAYLAKIDNLDEIAQSDPILKEYRFLFARMKEQSKHLLGGECEEILARMRLSGSNAWGDLQGLLTSAVQVDYNGGKTTLSSIRNLAYDKDPAVRKAAYEAELACYEKIADSVAFALNSIKLETITEAQLRGYESPLAETLADSAMKRETLDAMFAAIDEYLPKFWQYLRAKGKALGHENGLPWYDLFAPMGKTPEKAYTTEEAKAYLLDIFKDFDSDLHDMVASAFDNAWIDFYPREGKVGGAFCAGIPSLRESRILTNFDGAFGDVVTLAHELGHAFHNRCLNEQRPLNRDYSMPVAETASTFNECVIMNAAIAAATDPAQKLNLIENQLSDANQIICDIYSRYRFETAVFARREQEFLSAETLCQLMLDAQKQSYGDGLDENALHPYMWVCKSHYYGPIFYNFPYAFGGLFARGLYAMYEEQGEAFVPKYKALLKATPVTTAEDTAKVVGVDLTDKNFWKKGLQILADEIDEFLKLVEA